MERQLDLPRPHLLWLHSSYHFKVWLNGKKLGCNNFAQYVDLYLGPKLKPDSAPCAQRAQTESAVLAPRPPPAAFPALAPPARGCATHTRELPAPLRTP